MPPSSSLRRIATVDTAITAMKEGAQEYIVKPCNPEEISLLVKRIIKVKNLQRENTILRKKLTRQYRFQDIISKNPRMQEIFELIRDISSLRSTVLIQGESGTGKGVDRAGDPLFGRPIVRTVRGCVLCRVGRDTSGIRAVRARKRLVHRGDRAEEGKVRTGRPGDNFPGRDRRHLIQASDGPPARSAGDGASTGWEARRRFTWMSA